MKNTIIKKFLLIISIIIIMLLDLLARFRPRTINKLSEGDSDENNNFNFSLR